MNSGQFSSLYIPEQARNYFPKISDLKTTHGDRLIFDGNAQFDDKETSKILRFKAYSQKHHYTLHPMWSDNLILRFLYANSFDMSKTLGSVKDHTQWTQTCLPVQVDEELKRYLDSGILYVHGRDNKFRPIVVFNINMIDPKNFNYDAITRYLTFWFEHIIQEWMLPGQVESWVFIVNLKDMKISISAVSSLKKMFTYLMDNYKCRLAALYMVNASPSIYVPWKIVRTFLDEITLRKINFYKTSKPESLFNSVNPAQVEIRFGGSAPNCTQYWPPRIPANNFFVSKDDENALFTVEASKPLNGKGDSQDSISNRNLVENSGTPEAQNQAQVEFVTPYDVLSDSEENKSSKFRDEPKNEPIVDLALYADLPDDLDENTDYIEYMNEFEVNAQIEHIVNIFQASFM